MKKPLRPFPLVCPGGTQLHLREEFAGQFEWCEDAQGLKQGPYRSWFSTGIYLMARGQFRDDENVGEWLICTRFESCSTETNPD